MCVCRLLYTGVRNYKYQYVCAAWVERGIIWFLYAKEVNKLGSSKGWTAVCEIDLLAAMRRAWER